ncbi:hypothetical protein AHF37_12409 [Paragonimus kellicotti]|nr:hypothetical protein AHF37_12409 [Paragonimus kellicotti]
MTKPAGCSIDSKDSRRLEMVCYHATFKGWLTVTSRHFHLENILCSQAACFSHWSSAGRFEFKG